MDRSGRWTRDKSRFFGVFFQFSLIAGIRFLRAAGVVLHLPALILACSGLVPTWLSLVRSSSGIYIYI